MKLCSSLRSCSLALALTAVAATLALTGCAKLGYTRGSSEPADSLPRAAAEIDLAKRQVEEVKAALQAIAGAPAGSDLKPAYERYRDAVTTLDQTLALFKVRTQAMLEGGDKYFASWRARVADLQGESRDRSAARESTLKDHFAQIRGNYLIVRHEFDPLMVKLHDARAVLSVDLAQSGVERAKDYAPKVAVDARMTLQALDNLSESLRVLGADGTVAMQ